MSYSDLEEEPSKATIVGLVRGNIESVLGTSFNLLSNYELRIDEIIFDNGNLTEHEKITFDSTEAILMIIKSSLTMENLDLKTDYGPNMVYYSFFYTINLQDKLLKLQNLDTDISSYWLTSKDPASLHMENVMVDFSRTMGGVFIYVD